MRSVNPPFTKPAFQITTETSQPRPKGQQVLPQALPQPPPPPNPHLSISSPGGNLHTHLALCLSSEVRQRRYLRQYWQMNIFEPRGKSSGYGDWYHTSMSKRPISIECRPGVSGRFRRLSSWGGVVRCGVMAEFACAVSAWLTCLRHDMTISFLHF